MRAMTKLEAIATLMESNTTMAILQIIGFLIPAAAAERNSLSNA